MQLAPYYCKTKSPSRHRRCDDQGRSFGPLADSDSHDKGCGGGDDPGIERKGHVWLFDKGLEGTNASRETIKGVSMTRMERQE